MVHTSIVKDIFHHSRGINCLVCVFRSDLMRFIQELRSSSGGTFGSMALQDVVGGVTQLILDHQVIVVFIKNLQTFGLVLIAQSFILD